MSEKFTTTDDGALPPYEETASSLPSSASKENTRQSIHTQLTETRTRRIQSLIATSIEPLLYSHFLDGIYKRVFLLIPSDTLTQQPNLTAKDIVGLPDTNTITVIHLLGDENRAAFWQQPGVLQELASSLRARLAASGHKVESTTNLAAPAETAQPSPHMDQSQQQQQQQRQRLSPSWFKKQFGTPAPNHDPTATTNYRLGWRSEEEDLPRRTLGPDEVRVFVKVRDVSFRVETEMGLLDSVTGKVLWLELEVGT